ncbi:MAG: hypothetical protein AAF633_14350 [Chloroflexota bacterium]
MNRSLALLIFGLIFGALVGLYLGWVVFPLELTDVSPVDLSSEEQNSYLRLIASTYVAEGDLEAAQLRIGTLGNADWPNWLTDETINAILDDPSSEEALHLVTLSEALGLSNPNFDIVRESVNQSEPVEGSDGSE